MKKSVGSQDMACSSSPAAALLLAALCCCSLHLAFANQIFTKASAVASSCSAARTKAVSARSDIECAALSTRDDAWRSFSFVNGVCKMSDSSECSGIGAAEVFKSSGIGAAEVFTSSGLGYGRRIGDRRFWVFQQRRTGAVSFARNWTEYERGFGDIDDFWIGLQSLNRITQYGNATLRIEMNALNGVQYVAEWSNFKVGDASTNYTMQYSQYLTGSSNVSGDALDHHKGMQFSTFDRDNDKYEGMSCSVEFGNSGFWFNACVRFVPNGLFSTTEMRSATYMSCIYISNTQSYSTLQAIQMMVQLD